MIIYLDLDGVLCDFIGKYRTIRTDLPDTKEKFFLAIKENRIFATLDKLKDCDKLLNFVFNEVNAEVQILSSLGTYNKEYSALVREQKEEWLDRHNIFCKRNFVNSYSLKKDYATEDSLLIDDRIECHYQFIENRGKSVLYIDNNWSVMKQNIEKAIQEIKNANLHI